MFRSTSLFVVFLLSGCGSAVLTCHTDSDCPPIDVCQSSNCVTLERRPDGGSDAGRPDAGIDAGRELPSMEFDAGARCTPRRCADLGATCGSTPDGCGGQLSCGTCTAPETCGALVANRCGCEPKTCATLRAGCGTNLPDGCGGTIASCGPVPDCGGGQWSCDRATYACRCAPSTCTSLNATCGTNVSNGCGGTIPLCGAGLDCGGGQMFCDQAVQRCACRPKTCATLGATCGTNLPDGCGGSVASCGACGRFELCGAQLSCVCASSVDAPDELFQDTNCDGVDGDASQAVFVSMFGYDSNSGARSAPVLTLTRALAIATSSGKPQIFIATGRYLAPSTWTSGVSLYGGYDVSWNRSSSLSARAIIRAPSTGLLIDRLTSAITFERVIIQGADASAGAAAQALRVINSGNLLNLRFVHLAAGKAGAGVDGAAGAAGVRGAAGFRGESATRGLPNTSPRGGIGGLSAGQGSGFVGGNGGAGSNVEGQWGAGPAAGAGGWAGCYSAGNGTNGGVGWTPSAGASGTSAKDSGSLNAAGLWLAPFPATAGQSGREGGGGSSGGGGGKLTCLVFQEAGGGGGGGGASGTGGSGGAPGSSGGASIALVLIASSPSLTAVSLETGNAGDGGVGGNGGVGGAGGAGGVGGRGVSWIDGLGTVIQSGLGGWGGSGGFGSAGGRGGDGAPGANIGVWCSGVTGFLGGNGTTWILGAPGLTGLSTGRRVNLFGC